MRPARTPLLFFGGFGRVRRGPRRPSPPAAARPSSSSSAAALLEHSITALFCLQQHFGIPALLLLFLPPSFVPPLSFACLCLLFFGAALITHAVIFSLLLALIFFFSRVSLGASGGLRGGCRAGPAFRGLPSRRLGESRARGGDCEEGPGCRCYRVVGEGGGSGCEGKIEKSIAQAGGRERRAERAKQKEMKSFKKLRAAEHF